MKGLIILALAFAAVSAVPHRQGLENRDFYVPKHNLNWKQLASELAKDKIRKQTNNFTYKKGTKQYDDICGLENSNGQKIVGGQEALPNQFPWLVALFANSWFCSASLLSEEWVLTAAHCVDGASSWEVYAGSHDLSLSSERHRMIIKTSESFLHPDWNPNTLANDVALIKLPKETELQIEFTDEFILPSCLPAYSDVANNLEGEVVTATGWGKLSDQSSTKSDRLNFAKNLPVMNNDECNTFYGIITDGHLCINTEGGHGVCNGDSGGPLNYEKSTGKYMTVGVASFVSSFGCASGYPHGFTRVTEYLQWIESVTGIQISE